MRNYKNYLIWEKSHKFTLRIYKLTNTFPKEELYNLVSQMRRSASSIPTNIAEGCGRNSDKDFLRFLYFAYGSANEIEYQLILSKDLKFIDSETGKIFLSEVEEIKKMLNSLIQKINS